MIDIRLRLKTTNKQKNEIGYVGGHGVKVDWWNHVSSYIVISASTYPSTLLEMLWGIFFCCCLVTRNTVGVCIMGQFHKSALQITCCYLECAYLLRSLLIQTQHVHTTTLYNVMLLLHKCSYWVFTPLTKK